MKRYIFYLVFLGGGVLYNLKANGQNKSHDHKTNKSEFLAAKTAVNYLKWYITNQDQLNKIATISKKTDSSQTYYVDFEKVNSYLNELKKSGYVSDYYLNDYSELFDHVAWKLEKYPQNDGPIRDLEFDIILKVLEDDDIKSNINQIKTNSVKIWGDNAVVFLRLNNANLTLLFILRKSVNNTWLIHNYKPIYDRDH